MTKITNPVQSPQNNGMGNKGTAENPYTEAEYNEMIDNGTWTGGYVEDLGYCGRNTDITYDPDNSQSESETSNSDSNRWGHWSSFPWSSNYDSSSWRSTPWGSWSSSSSQNNTGKNTNPTEDNSREGGGVAGTTNPYPQTTRTVKNLALEYSLIEGVGLQATFVFQYSMTISGYKMRLSASVMQSNFYGKEFWATAIVIKGSVKEYHRLEYSEQGYISEEGFCVIGDCTFNLPSSGNVVVKLLVGFNYDTGIGNSGESKEVQVYPF